MAETESETEQTTDYAKPDEIRFGWTAHDLAVIVVRGLALYCAILAAPILHVVILFIFEGSGNLMLFATYAASYALYAFLAGVLWVCSPGIAAMMLPNKKPVDDPVGSSHVQAMAISVIGLLFIGWGISYLSKAVAQNANTGEWELIGNPIATAAIEIAFGLFLFLRGKGLAVLWHGIRFGGIKHQDDRQEG